MPNATAPHDAKKAKEEVAAMAVKAIEHPSVDKRQAMGKEPGEAMTPLALTFYARACGWTLARAHARSGDPVAIAAYLGDSDAFDQSITDFSQRYANQNERDYQKFITAVRSGRLEAREGV